MRKILFFIILLTTLGFSSFILFNKIDTKSKRSLSPLMQLIGKGTKTLDRLVTKIVPINEIDEKELGMIYKLRYKRSLKEFQKETKYINSIIKGLSIYKKKKFDYKGFVVRSFSPNAFALPGGVIVITNNLLKVLKNEAQLVSIIAHEMGHIELGHCFDGVRYQLLSKKLGAKNLGQIADIFYRFLIAHSFSKAEENESDQYAYNILVQSPYSPTQMGEAFKILENKSEIYNRHHSKSSILRDYFSTHPSLRQRRISFDAKAKYWELNHKDEKRYIGIKNLEKLQSYYSGYRIKNDLP